MTLDELIADTDIVICGDADTRPIPLLHRPRGRHWMADVDHDTDALYVQWPAVDRDRPAAPSAMDRLAATIAGIARAIAIAVLILAVVAMEARLGYLAPSDVVLIATVLCGVIGAVVLISYCHDAPDRQATQPIAVGGAAWSG